MARRLAACWFNVCCQIDYNSCDDNDDVENFDASGLIQSLTSGPSYKMSDFFENPDLLASDDSQDADYHPDFEMEGDSDDDDDDDDYDEDEDEDITDIVEEKHNFIQEDDDDDLPPLLDKNNLEIVEDMEFKPTISPEEEELRKVVFRVTEKLQSFMPDPESSMHWFKRSLRHIKSAQSSADMTWYPWGCPPMEALISTLKSDDNDAKCIAASIILLFQQQLKQATNECSEDFDYDEEDNEDDLPQLEPKIINL